MENQIIDNDSYKDSHPDQYPPEMKAIFEYMESRGGHYSWNQFFGLQYILQTQLANPITVPMVYEAAEISEVHGTPFPFDDWMFIAIELEGKLPLHIRAVPEGTVVPCSNIMMSIESTRERTRWLPSWMETRLMRVWYPIGVSTKSAFIKAVIWKFLEKTSDNPTGEILFKLHDFGSRGVSSRESAGIGGLAHLVNFRGTDTKWALLMGRRHYQEKMAGFSIPAGEHSTFITWGRNRQFECIENMINKFGKPGSIIAMPMDSYDIYDTVGNIVCSDRIQNLIKQKECKFVCRPDSGNPAKMVLAMNEILEAKLGMTKNTKGFKILPSHMGIIQGDGIDETSIEEIENVSCGAGYSASNIGFGMGGALLQKINRDTQENAIKPSSMLTSDGWQDVWKEPVTSEMKRSKRGRLDLIKNPLGQFETVTLSPGEVNPPSNSELQTVFKNGELFNQESLQKIRDRADSYFFKTFCK